MEWTDDLVLEFIQNIQNHPCLWNPRDPHKTNRKKVNNAFRMIASEIGIDVDVLRHKKESLFQIYRNYRRKIASSHKSAESIDDLYFPPWTPFLQLDAFLREVYTPKGYVDPLDISQTTINKLKRTNEETNDDLETPDFDVKSSENVNLPPLKKYKPSPVKRIIKLPRKEPDPPDIGVQDFTPASNQKVEKNTSSSQKDLCDVYSELLSMKLKKLDERTQQLAMHKIDNIVFELTFKLPQIHSVYTLQPEQSPGSDVSQSSQNSNVNQPHTSTSDL